MKCSNCPRCASTIQGKDAFCDACGYILRARRSKPPAYSSPISLVDSPQLLALSPCQVTHWPLRLIGSAASLLRMAGSIALTAFWWG